jgi:hypothetical protein
MQECPISRLGSISQIGWVDDPKIQLIVTKVPALENYFPPFRDL